MEKKMRRSERERGKGFSFIEEERERGFDWRSEEMAHQ